MHRARRRQDDRGASLVELALIAPVMILIVMGVLDLTRAYRMQIRLENAAREGASYAMIDPSRANGCVNEDVRTRVEAEDATLTSLPGFDVDVWTDTDGTDDMAVELTGCGTSTEGAPGDRIRVDVRARFDVLTPMIEDLVGGEIEISGSATVEAQ